MPNHVHVLVEPLMPYSLAKIVQAWKSFTAHEINRKVDRNGKLWQDEYWDRFMRNGEHYRSSINYIVENPVKAGLVEHASDWPWTFPTTERPKIERSPGSADVPVRIM
jgi:putative DNA methylase